MTQYEIGELDLTAQASAAKTATNFITTVASDGIMVADAGHGAANGTVTSNTTGWHIGGVLEFIRNGVSRFWIGLKNPQEDTTPTVRIGKEYVSGATDNESHMELDYHSLQLVDKSNSTYFWVSDRLDENGTCLMTEVFVVGSSNVRFGGNNVYMTPSLNTVHNTGLGSGEIIGVESVQGDGVTFSSETIYDGDIRATPSDLTKLVDGFKITVIYETNSSLAKAYTAGVRSSNPAYSNYPGAMSFAEGLGGVASGPASHVEGLNLGSDYGTELMATGLASHAEGINSMASEHGSHAEGYLSKALGRYSHAEGTLTTASGGGSHAEGSVTTASGASSHAEGNGTTARNSGSHAEGFRTIADGYYSHAQNYKTMASSEYQTAIGKWNVDDVGIDTFLGDGSTSVFDRSGYDFDYILAITVDDEDVTDKVTLNKTNNRIVFKKTPANRAVIKVKYALNTYALIIGNGTDEDSRSNALAVKWNGDVEIDNGRIEISDSG